MNEVNFSLKNCSPIFCKIEEAYEVLEAIRSLKPGKNIVVVDARMIDAMTVKCARIIFGTLYLELGNVTYNECIRVVYNNDLSMVINIGIVSALEKNNPID